jgi:hypothetical protein
MRRHPRECGSLRAVTAITFEAVSPADMEREMDGSVARCGLRRETLTGRCVLHVTQREEPRRVVPLHLRESPASG